MKNVQNRQKMLKSFPTFTCVRNVGHGQHAATEPHALYRSRRCSHHRSHGSTRCRGGAVLDVTATAAKLEIESN
jgi:hypothetical protein